MSAVLPSTPARPRRRSATTDLALIASFAALIAVCGLLPAIPIGVVPITLQTFAVLLAGAVLGANRGALAVLLWLAVGAIGLPVFSAGGAGLAPFAGPSVGYLISFAPTAFVTGFIAERLPRRRIATSVPLLFLAGLVATVLVTYPLGSLGMAWRADLAVPDAFLFGLTFMPGDILKCVLMAVVATSVHRAFPALLPSRTPAQAPAHHAPTDPVPTA